MSGNIGIVGANEDDENGFNSGSAYVFRGLDTAAGTVFESVKLLASNGDVSDNFGVSVSLSGNIALIGADEDDDNAGSAYVFRDLDTATGTINESLQLLASDGQFSDFFGASVSLSGNTGIIGAPLDDLVGFNSGSAYVFRGLDTATGTITESLQLAASDGADGDFLGGAVSLDGDIGLVGATNDDDNGAQSSGSAFVFRGLNTGTGVINESVKLLASDGGVADFFGNSVSLSGNIGLVGAVGEDSNGLNSGSAYIFRDLDTATGVINESAELLASDNASGDNFGRSVSLSGSTGLVGAEFDDENGINSGAAYIFRDLDSATGIINESVKLLASNGAAGDFFGEAVSLDGDRFTIGASNADGIALISGVAYTGTVSSVTTLDFGNTSAIIDGISFESRVDWIVGETTSNNILTLTQFDSAEVLEPDTAVFIGANAGSNSNVLVVSGTIEANNVFVGAEGNYGNYLILDSTATNLIDEITLSAANSLLLEGEFLTFDSLDSQLLTTDLFVSLDGVSELVTGDNFGTLLFTNFDSTTGFTRFTAVPEPSAGLLLSCALMAVTRRRRSG